MKGINTELDTAKAVFKHFRYDEDTHELKHYRRGCHFFRPATRGGATHCWLYDLNDKMIAHGKAGCTPDDTFSYKDGRDFALAHALMNYACSHAHWAKKKHLTK